MFKAKLTTVIIKIILEHHSYFLIRTNRTLGKDVYIHRTFSKMFVQTDIRSTDHI